MRFRVNQLVGLAAILALLLLQSAAAAPGDTTADRVFGQGSSFTSGDGNLGNGSGGPASASSFCNPSGVTIDAAGNLYVADDGNSRVLEYDSSLTTDMVADLLFGQAGIFTSNTCTASPSASSFCYPFGGVAVDAAGNLYVAD